MRILVADDEVTTRLLLKALVTRLGHECLLAEDGLGAWELLCSETIDVLLTDWMMPGVDGPELCRRVRQEFNGRNNRYTYIVLITGLGQREQVLEGMSAGADDYLVKPVVAFDVQTSLVAAERVTVLHHQVADYRRQLELANQELRTLSLTDPLTGLGNRRRMDQDLMGAHALGLRDNRPFSVALFDIDHFKLYNEHYGHLGGDDALRRVADRLSHVLRLGESVYRYGGEEFLLLLPNCDTDGAALVAERMRWAIEETAMPHLGHPAMPSLLTMSGAVACWSPSLALSIPELLAHVDAALYQAKAAGRNRIHVAMSAASF